MTREQGRLASLLLGEAFGEVVENVGTYLIKCGPCTLGDIKKNLNIQGILVKKSLCVLIQHQLVTHELEKKQLTAYRINLDSIVQRIRFPRCIHAAKQLHGDAGELIVEDILQQGHTLLSQCIRRVSRRFEEGGITDDKMVGLIKQQFDSLVKDQFLVRVHPIVSELADVRASTSTATVAGESLPVDPPALDAAVTKEKSRKRKVEGSTEERDQPKAKRKKKIGSIPPLEEVPADVGTLWQVDHSTFQQYFRDQAIAVAVAHQLDETAANVMKCVLSLAQPVNMQTARGKELFGVQIANALPKKPRLSSSELDQYFNVLVNQSGFLLKTDDSGGGAYAINFKQCSKALCTATVECVVRERFGSKALRVFRLLLMKKMLDQKQVTDMAMIPSKEAKELLYTLLAENFVNLQEIPKTSDYAPSRTFYLFSVQLLPVAVMVKERCFKAMGNLISKRNSEMKENRRLLERHQLHEKQLMKVEGEAVEEVEEILTPDEMKKVEAVKRSITRLEHAELQLDETIFTLTHYTQLHMQAAPPPTNKK